MSDGNRGPKAQAYANRLVSAGRASDGGLQKAVEHNGGELLGLSVKFGQADCLVTLRAVFPGGRMVAFVGGDSLMSCLVKVHRDGFDGKLKWRTDKYHSP